MVTKYISYGLVCPHLGNLWISQSWFIFGEFRAKTRHSSYTSTLSATLSNDSATMKLLPLTENILKYNETNNKILPTALV